MSNISIREEEETLYTTFDATENTVLIPLLYARDFTAATETTEAKYTEVTKSRLFTNASDFVTFMSGHIVSSSKTSNVFDKSYVMAYELLVSGLNVVIKPIEFDNAADKYHDDVATGVTYVTEEDELALVTQAVYNGALDEFQDRNIYNIKFITSGALANAVPVSFTDASGATVTASMESRLTELAADRGDCIALVELKEVFADKAELLNTLEGMSMDSNHMYSACFFPWCTFKVSVDGANGQETLPACFAYLKAYASSVKTNANWFAASGVTRGQIPNLVAPNFEVGESLMHILQGDNASSNGSFLDIRVNPIYNAGTYGYRIWGNRVAWSSSNSTKLKYQEFLNVRVLLCDIKKQTFHAAMRTTFEPNDDIVWINFKGLVNTLLEQMVSGRGLVFYRWAKQKSDDKAKIKATLTIKPIEAVESFDINIVLTEDETTVSESL